MLALFVIIKGSLFYRRQNSGKRKRDNAFFLLLPRWGSQQMSLDQASRYDEWKCHQKLWKWVHEPTNFLDHLLAPHEHLMKRTHTDKTNRLRRLQQTTNTENNKREGN